MAFCQASFGRDAFERVVASEGRLAVGYADGGFQPPVIRQQRDLDSNNEYLSLLRSAVRPSDATMCGFVRSSKRIADKLSLHQSHPLGMARTYVTSLEIE